MSQRWGHSPLMWPKKLSIQAWSVGVLGRPWCWAIATAAMKARVSVEIMGPPLSDTASRIGRRGFVEGQVEALVGQQVDEALDGGGVVEHDTDLGAGLL